MQCTFNGKHFDIPADPHKLLPLMSAPGRLKITFADLRPPLVRARTRGSMHVRSDVYLCVPVRGAGVGWWVPFLAHLSEAHACTPFRMLPQWCLHILLCL